MVSMDSPVANASPGLDLSCEIDYKLSKQEQNVTK